MDAHVRSPGSHVFGPFRLDPNRRVLTCNGGRVALRPTVFAVLLHLVENAGRLVEKDELLDAVWQNRVVEEANLSQAVFWLRAALREQGGEAAEQLIATVRGRGYRFAGEARWEPSGAPIAPSNPSTPPAARIEPQIHSDPPDISDVPPPASIPVDGGAPEKAWPIARWRTPALAAGVLVAVVLVAGGLWKCGVGRGGRRLAPGNTVVLADFQNRTRDPAFDRTLDSVLRIDLGQSPYVTVLSDKQARDTLSLMTRPADAVMTAALAQDVCLRANGDAVLSGGVYTVGARYVLTLAATDCSGQRALGGATEVVPTREAVVPVLERLIGKLRRRLGEPIQSIDRFNVPLAPERTASLDALKAYSEGRWLSEHGHRNEAAPLFKHAIEIDPKFAGAYVGLMGVYAGTNQDSLAADAIARAYELRDTLDERQRLAVSALYNQFYTRDFNAASRVLGIWTTIDPSDAKAWGNLANVENVLGRYAQAIGPATRALALNPASEQPYVVLARAYLRSGHADLARAIGARAIKQGVAGDATHAVLLAAASMQHDGAGVQREANWGRGKPAERILLVVEGQIAYAQGRIHDGDRLFDQSADLSREQGLPDFAQSYRARLLNDLGLHERARQLLATVSDDEDDDLIFTMAEIDDPSRAAALLSEQVHKHPQGTLITYDFVPEVRAALALRQSRALDAIAALQPALPYESRTFDIPYVLGRSYLAAGDGSHAKAAFQLILDHPGWYPESPLYTLARLGVARALKLQRDPQGAHHAYQALLAAWQAADSDFAMRGIAQRENAQLH